ncbi:MAG TPA: DNA mismatch repair protein MutS, partial [Kiloniellales bacterium]|nr:DNA mismatch repair protein MutS [Kiloniellales bacterium]
PDRFLERERAALAPWLDRLTPLPGARFDSLNGEARLKALFKVATLAAYGDFGRAELAALGALVDYIELTQKGRLPQLAPPARRGAGSRLLIDQATRRNLELFATLAGERRGSLLAATDRTVTGGGARLLAQRLSAPLTERVAIERRLDAVAFLLTETALREELRQGLRAAPDAERALSRLTLGRGGPRDLLALARALKIAEALGGKLAEQTGLPPALASIAEGLGRHDALVATLEGALAEEPPPFARDGGFVRAGHSAELDELRQLRDESRRLIAGLQADYARRVGVNGLRIKHNNVLGYFVELSAVQAERLPPDVAGKEGFLIHRQTLASAVRYTTAELGQLEQKILSAGDKALALELAIFETLVGAVVAEASAIQRAARALAKLDVAAGLAELASDGSYVRPEIREDSSFAVTGGRHPVVEQALAAEGQRFVANDCDLSEGRRLWLLTGPNMAGKSTFLRQNALIAVLAQAGSFVPAERAQLGIVDRLFSRVGAADDLARGRSTFMVEMVETAAILNQASPRSLVILDEIGRGTATFDGLSIAWATLEQLHEANRCRALFATHFHELTRLAKRLPNLSLNTMRVREWKGEVVFLHQVAPGAADRSYGIHVAKLAGLPAAVVARAEEVLAQLEAGQDAGALARLVDDLPLFQAAERRQGQKKPSALLQRLAEIRPDELSPRQALELIYELRRLAEEETSK